MFLAMAGWKQPLDVGNINFKEQTKPAIANIVKLLGPHSCLGVIEPITPTPIT